MTWGYQQYYRFYSWGLPHPLNMTNLVITFKRLRSPPLNHIFSYSLWHESSRRIFGCIPRGSPIPLNMTKLLIIPKRFRSPPLNHIFSYFIWYGDISCILNCCVKHITVSTNYCVKHITVSSTLLCQANSRTMFIYIVLLLTCRRHTSSREDSKLSFICFEK